MNVQTPDPPRGPRIGSLFSGSGMLDEGVRSVIGGTVAWHVENDPAASKVLAHRYPDVPNHGDITKVDWAGVEPVGVLTGGFPCQDVSPAGKRAGLAPGTRSGLWAHFRAAIAILHPSLVVIENVRGLLSASAGRSPEALDPDLDPLTAHLMELSDAEADAARAGSDLGSDDPDVGDDDAARPVLLRALGAVLGDLANLGLDADWVTLRAADVGAAHGRARVFVLAWPAADPSGLGYEWVGGARDGRTGPADRRGEVVPDASGIGRGEGRPQSARLVRGSDAALGGHGPVAAAHRCEAGEYRGHPDRLAVEAPGVDWGEFEPAIRRWERILGRPAPSPLGVGTKGQPKLSPQFDEWLMGWPEGWASDVPGVSWNDVLAMCGNGVVPQQSAAAVRFMLARLAEERRWAA